jgi:inosine-uridine nucleoside N-ribohydrolase
MQRRRIVLDMDVGIDDAIAIIYLAGRPDVEIVALGSVHGNCDGITAATNALRTLEVCGLSEVPVAVGALGPLTGAPSYSAHVHGADGLGETDQPEPKALPTQERAWNQLVRLANDEPGSLDLLAVGPLTNLARALAIDRQVLEKFHRVVVMGGSGPTIRAGDSMEMDWNIIHDPDAAQAVFDASENITMVGVNVTSPAVFSADDLERIANSASEQGKFAWSILQFYLDFYSVFWDRRSCSIHDPLAAGVLVDDAYVTSVERAPVEVVRRGAEARAVIKRDHRGPDVTVVTEVEASRFASDLAAVIAS